VFECEQHGATLTRKQSYIKNKIYIQCCYREIIFPGHTNSNRLEVLQYLHVSNYWDKMFSYYDHIHVNVHIRKRVTCMLITRSITLQILSCKSVRNGSKSYLEK
jgi:hypothetical protein